VYQDIIGSLELPDGVVPDRASLSRICSAGSNLGFAQSDFDLKTDRISACEKRQATLGPYPMCVLRNDDCNNASSF
jgi:hypothetical protein